MLIYVWIDNFLSTTILKSFFGTFFRLLWESVGYNVWSHFWTFYSVSLLYKSISIPKLFCFCHYGICSTFWSQVLWYLQYDSICSDLTWIFYCLLWFHRHSRFKKKLLEERTGALMGVTLNLEIILSMITITFFSNWMWEDFYFLFSRKY